MKNIITGIIGNSTSSKKKKKNGHTKRKHIKEESGGKIRPRI